MGYNRPESIVVLSLLCEFNVLSFDVPSDNNSVVKNIQINMEQFKQMNDKHLVVNKLITEAAIEGTITGTKVNAIFLQEKNKNKFKGMKR